MGRFFESTELDEILHDYSPFLRQAGGLLNAAGWTHDSTWDDYVGLAFLNEDDTYAVVFGGGDENPYASKWSFWDHGMDEKLSEGADLPSLRKALEQQGFTI